MASFIFVKKFGSMQRVLVLQEYPQMWIGVDRLQQVFRHLEASEPSPHGVCTPRENVDNYEQSINK